MNFSKYISRTSNVFAENRLFKFVLLVMALIIVFLVIKLTSLAINQKVVLVPTGLSDKVQIGDSYADDTYLTAMGVYIATLMYSTTPATVEAQYGILSKLFDNAAYIKYGDSLLLAAKNQAKNLITFKVRIENITIESEPKQEIRISVNLSKYIFDNQEPMEPHILVIGFKLVNGNFKITSLEEERRV